MIKHFTATEVKARLKETNEEGKPILVACCGNGLIAKCAAAAGADIIMTACSSKSRLMGLPTTVLGDVNADMLKLCAEIVNVVKTVPIIVSLDATDPTWMDLSVLLEEAVQVGYSGVLNYPTVGILHGTERRLTRESVGLGFEREVEMMRVAKRMGLFTMAYAFTPEDAVRMAEVPVDCLVAHVGSTRGGLTGFKASPLKVAAEQAQRIIDAAVAVNREMICLAHGGPFASPEDTQFLYDHTSAAGFVGASSIERIPIERAVTEIVRQFKAIPLRVKKTEKSILPVTPGANLKKKGKRKGDSST